MSVESVREQLVRVTRENATLRADLAAALTRNTELTAEVEMRDHAEEADEMNLRAELDAAKAAIDESGDATPYPLRNARARVIEAAKAESEAEAAFNRLNFVDGDDDIHTATACRSRLDRATQARKEAVHALLALEAETPEGK